MQKTLKRLLSFMLCVMMLVTMFPVSAFAAEWEDNQPIMDSGSAPKHWLQEYQEYVLVQIAAAGEVRAIAASGSSSYRMITWAGGDENGLKFSNGAYLNSGMPRITLNGQVAFCAEWNGSTPGGSYIQSGEGDDPVIKQILANFDNSSQSDADYAAAQAAIWAHLMNTTIDSWGACPGAASANAILNGHHDYSNLKYNYLEWSGGLQDLITYNNGDEPYEPPEEPPEEPGYHTEVTTSTSTETEVRNRKSYEYSSAIGQLTIRKHDQDGRSLDGALFDIDVAFTDGSHITVNGWEVDNGARLFTWTHPANNHDPATVTVKEVKAPNGYILDSRTQTAVVTPTYTRVTHVETWTVTIVTETTSSTTIDIDSGEVVSESSSSSTAETASEPQVEEFADFVEGDRETTITFINEAAPCSLTIYKYETGNKGIALEGASFRIRYADPSVSAQTWTLTTDKEGKIYIALPYAGALIVEELSAPAGYVMTSKTIYDVTVAKGEDKVLEISNDKKTQLVVLKKDAQTGQLLAGATIQATLLRSNTPPYEAGQTFTATTGTDGRAIFTDLIPGEYRVEEISPPQYYQGTSEVHTVNIPEGNSATITLEFRNEPWIGLIVKKVDATDGRGLQGAVFKLFEGTAADSSRFLGDFQTDENGIFVVQKLESGKYYTIVESQPPYGYFLDAENSVQTILIKPDALDGNISVIFRNKPKPKLLIEKVDAVTGVRLPGATFRVSRRGSNEYVDVTTGSDGTVLLENMEEDWYKVVELRSPTGYTLDDTPHDIELISGKTSTLTVKDSRRPGLRLEKIDADTGAHLEGAVFRVTRRDTGESVDVTTGASGIVLVDNLDPGWYEVYEYRAPTGYTADDAHYDIELIAGKTAELIIKNSKRPSLTIEKIDSMTLQPLEGVVFEISIKDGKSLGQFETNADGKIILEDADPDLIYLVKEVRALPGYLSDDTVYEFTLTSAENGVIKLTNTPEHPLLIVKKDAVTGEPIPDTVFLVTHSDGRLVGEYRTGPNGMATVTDIDPGWYLVKETKANPSYISNGEAKLVELKLGDPAVVEIYNKPRTGLQIRKVDDVTGEPLEGVQFKVTEISGAIIGTFTTDADGIINIGDRDEGWVQVTEIQGLEGYKADPTPRNIELKSGQLNILEYRNQPYPILQIIKLDAETRRPLGGVTVKVFDKLHREIGIFRTNSLGQILLTDIDGGETLYVQEVEALPGYELDATVYEVTLAWGQTSTVEIFNKEKATLRIIKIDAESGEPIYGVTFNLYDSKNNLLGEYTTDQEGIIEFSKELPAGKYKLKEIKADGYVVDPTIRTIEVKSGETTEIVIENQPMRGKIQIIKKSADDNAITKDKAGALLEGAIFEIIDENLEVVDTITTDEKGIATTKPLPLATYAIKEVVAPSHYLLKEKGR